MVSEYVLCTIPFNWSCVMKAIAKIHTNLLALRDKQKGLTTVEYAVAGSVIVLAAVGAFILLGGNVNTAIRALAGNITTP
jgi:pilus assembly protein Flp/PilA